MHADGRALTMVQRQLRVLATVESVVANCVRKLRKIVYGKNSVLG